MTLHAAILAGGRVDGEFARRLGTPVKALARICGITLLERAIAAARSAGAQRIAVVGGEEVRAACGHLVERLIDETQDGTENVHRAIFSWPDVPLLLASSDLPFARGEHIREFLKMAPADAVGMPLVSAAAYARAFPGSPSHATSLFDERIVNGSVFYLPPNSAPRIDAFAQKFFRARKSRARMALLLGPQLILRFALQRLAVEDLERQAERMLGLPAKAVRGSSPALCYDIDSAADYEYALARN